jgi:hypothetical protein
MVVRPRPMTIAQTIADGLLTMAHRPPDGL